MATANGVDAKHPTYGDHADDWALMADAMAGEGAIKRAGVKYLPKPQGFSALPDRADQEAAYAAYMNRASFPEFVAPTVSALHGMAKQKGIAVELPAALEFMRENATGGRPPVTIDALFGRILHHLLTTGRVGALADVDAAGAPKIALYTGTAVTNWDTDFFVLDESGDVRTRFSWERRKQYRVLELDEAGLYVQTVHTGDTLAAANTYEPKALGGKRLNFVPFYVANSREVSPKIVPPPLIGVARAAKNVYQLSADKRFQLFFSGQETLFIYNASDAPEYTGAMAIVTLNGAPGQTPKAEYVGPDCKTINEHDKAIRDEREAAVMAGARMLEQSEGVTESGNARELRFASETSNVFTIITTAAELLELALRGCAAFAGADPNEVNVSPPEDLLSGALTPAEAEALARLWIDRVISYETLHQNLQRGKIIPKSRDAEAEQALIDGEDFGATNPTTPAAMPQTDGDLSDA